MNAISNFYYAVKDFLADASETLGVGIQAGLETWKTELAVAHHEQEHDEDEDALVYQYKSRPNIRCEQDANYCNKCNYATMSLNRCYRCD